MFGGYPIPRHVKGKPWTTGLRDMCRASVAQVSVEEDVSLFEEALLELGVGGAYDGGSVCVMRVAEDPGIALGDIHMNNVTHQWGWGKSPVAKRTDGNRFVRSCPVRGCSYNRTTMAIAEGVW